MGAILVFGLVTWWMWPLIRDTHDLAVADKARKARAQELEEIAENWRLHHPESVDPKPPVKFLVARRVLDICDTAEQYTPPTHYRVKENNAGDTDQPHRH